MNGRHHATRLLALCIIAVLALAGPQTMARAQYVIDYVIRPYQPAIWDSELFGINNHGVSTGYVTTGSRHNFAQISVNYRGGDIQLLFTGPVFDGGLINRGTTGRAINDRGDVAGTIAPVNNFLTLPVFYAADGTQTHIVVPGLEFTFPFGLNDSRTVLALGFPTRSTTLSERYGLWTLKGSRLLTVLDPLYPVVLPPDPNDYTSGFQSFTYDQRVTGLNNSDQFAAGVRLFTVDPMDPTTYDDDVFTDEFVYAYVFNGRNGYSLLQPLAVGDEIMPIGIDNKGLVFGWSGNHLALWRPDGSIKFVFPNSGTSLLPPDPFGFVTAQRNERGQVLAITSDAGIARYDPKPGVWTNITASILGGPGHFYNIHAYNKRGQFVGSAGAPLNMGGYWGYVVSPVKDEDDED